tara:strand:- start:407 stop:613 length:207 start_codon:yes stop_codon:yes gene_type:complete
MKRWLTKNERWFWATAIVSLIVGYTYPVESEIQNISAAIVSIIGGIGFILAAISIALKAKNKKGDPPR